MESDSLVPEDVSLEQVADPDQDSCIVFKADGTCLLYLPPGCEEEDGNCNNGGIIASAVMCILDDPRVRQIIKEKIDEMVRTIESGVLDGEG